ncbi:MAG: CdaR family protein [Armatimonadota bacterium]
MIAFLIEAIKRNAWLKLLAAGFTVLLYLAAKTPGTQPVERDLLVRPVLTGIRTGLASPMVLPEVVIHLRGSERVLADLKSSLRLEADGRRATAGRNRIPLVVTLPPELKSEVTVDAPPTLVVLISASAKKKLAIQSVDSSDIVEYMFVEGAKELVDKSITIRRSALSLQSGSPQYEVLDADGEVVEPLTVLPIPDSKVGAGLQSKLVVVSCTFSGSPEAGAKVVGYTVSPPTIKLRGTADALATLENIPVEIQLAGIQRSTVIRKQLALPNGIVAESGASPAVDVRINVR